MHFFILNQISLYHKKRIYLQKPTGMSYLKQVALVYLTYIARLCSRYYSYIIEKVNSSLITLKEQTTATSIAANVTGFLTH